LEQERTRIMVTKYMEAIPTACIIVPSVRPELTWQYATCSMVSGDQFAIALAKLAEKDILTESFTFDGYGSITYAQALANMQAMTEKGFVGRVQGKINSLNARLRAEGYCS